MSFARYPAYKDTGVEWLGEVPEHWEIWKLTQGCELIGSGTTPKTEKIHYYEDGEIPWVNTGDLNDSDLLDCNKRITELAITDHSTLKLFPVGSVVIAMYGATIGKLAILKFSATVNQACCVFAGSGAIDKKFLFFWLMGFREQIVSLATGGGQPNISQEILRSLKLACPELQEQQAIATFLDTETAKIDGLMAEQRALVALLKEKRQAVISHAVTKGFNPAAPMKDSGVAWLGDVPGHWTLTRIKDFTTFTGGGTPSRENLQFWDGEIPWVSPKDMKVETITETEEHITEEGLQKSSASLISIGSVLMVVRSGILKHTIPVAINSVSVALNQDMKALAFHPTRCVSSFFLRWIQGLNSELLLAWAKQGATVESIEHAYLADTVLPLPPINEQIAIIHFLDHQTTQLDTLTQEAQTAIALLQERRTALISAAVTGKMDVRAAMAA